jgi:hypothetical protein
MVEGEAMSMADKLLDDFTAEVEFLRSTQPVEASVLFSH